MKPDFKKLDKLKEYLENSEACAHNETLLTSSVYKDDG
jgi:hypothetical protein